MLLLEEDLIARAQSGEREAFEQIVRLYQRKVYSVTYRFTGNTEDASDLAQEAFIKIYRSLSTFRGESSFNTWLHHVVANVCRDYLRKQQRRIQVVDNGTEDNPGYQLQVASSDEVVQPERQLMIKEQKKILQKHIEQLAPDYRLVLIMRDLQDLSYEEIAATLQINMGTVKSRLNRARMKLKESLFQEPYFAEAATAVERREKG